MKSVCLEPSVCTAFWPLSTPSRFWSLHHQCCLKELIDKDIREKSQHICGSATFVLLTQYTLGSVLGTTPHTEKHFIKSHQLIQNSMQLHTWNNHKIKVIAAVPKNHCTFTCCGCLFSSLSILYDFECSLILFFFIIPLPPVIQDAVKHGLDLWVEARKLLRGKHAKTNDITKEFAKMKTEQFRFVNIYINKLFALGKLKRTMYCIVHQSKCNIKHYLVDKRADKVNETTL